MEQPEIQIFAFAKIDDQEARASVYNEIKNGKSRFGMWDQKKSLNEEWHTKNSMLLKIKAGDWLVHVNMPEYGKCTATKATGEYDFDNGIECNWGADFNNFIPIDPSSVVDFNRNDSNIIPSVNLAPRKRIQRILEVSDFLTSLTNLNNQKTTGSSASNSTTHLQEKIAANILPQITAHIQEINKSKNLEDFLHKVFNKIPNVVSTQNGYGWGSDYGADLLVDFKNPIVGINITTRLVVQVKSFSGSHIETKAIDQIVKGIEKYEADAGLLITTGSETEELENYARRKSDEIGKTIDIIAGSEVAKFVLRYAPELLIGE